MRNTIISSVTFALIILYSFFSFSYLGNFIDSFRGDIQSITPNGADNTVYIEDATSILKSKKNILLLMISKEHINTLENSLSSLNTAIQFNALQDIDEYRALLLNSIEDVNEHNSSVN